MLGLVTIGQSPRDDVVSSMFPDRVPPIAQAGALDDLDSETIACLKPRVGEHVLVSRLINGTEVEISKERLLPHVQQAVERVVDAGATTICILCTGAFPTIHARVTIITPDTLLRAVVDATYPCGALGVLMPHLDQADMMQNKWGRESRRVVTASASPYEASSADLPSAVTRLTEQDVDLIVMDCMGFDRRMQAEVRELARCPVILSNGLVGGILAALTSG